MTFADYVNEFHPDERLTPWQLKMVHDISTGEGTVFTFGRSMGKGTVHRLLNEWQKHERLTLDEEDNKPE
jgi:hypothetical protein